ncbi:MAG: VCBS repeat-containing protein [Planctomycetes bacterium]|nr:VCBS repeat-containing protein [Planctomycetota bacterium]
MPTYAVINPALQPDIYFREYDNVLIMEIKSIEAQTGKLLCSTAKVIKGNHKVEEEVMIHFTGDMASLVGQFEESGTLFEGRKFPVFAGKPSRRKKNRQLRIYIDSFFVGEVKKNDSWNIGVADGTEKDTEGKLINTLAGIYCGMTEELIKMIEDMALDRDFYPRKAYIKFKPDMLLTKRKQPVQALALYDINGDGMEDIVVCSQDGDKVFFQLKPMKFTDVTKKVGLNSSSKNISLADVDNDGLNDILLDNKIYRGQFSENQFSFAPTPWLDAAVIKKTESLKSIAFVEINGDGYPDVVMSRAGVGLQAFLHPGSKELSEEKGYREVTQELGLHLPENGAGGNGYFMPGDWNGDHNSDLFYAHGDGLLLVLKDGQYKPVAHNIAFSFKTGMDEYGKTGAGVFAPTINQNHMDLIVPIEKDWLVIANQEGQPVDISKWGNEISEGSDYHLATVANDFNMDGYVDIYTICDEQKENRIILNRGYGSYMHGKVHVDEKPLFKGPAHAHGGQALAVGDINDDGAPDILVGNKMGDVFLIINDTLSMRVKKDYMKKDEKRLLETRHCTIRVLGPRGVVNAKVRLLNGAGEVLARHDLATNIATGCRGPDLVTLTVRKPGHYIVEVEYGDGHRFQQNVDLTSLKRTSILAQRSDTEDSDDW